MTPRAESYRKTFAAFLAAALFNAGGAAPAAAQVVTGQLGLNAPAAGIPVIPASIGSLQTAPSGLSATNFSGLTPALPGGLGPTLRPQARAGSVAPVVPGAGAGTVQGRGVEQQGPSNGLKIVEAAKGLATVTVPVKSLSKGEGEGLKVIRSEGTAGEEAAPTTTGITGANASEDAANALGALKNLNESLPKDSRASGRAFDGMAIMPPAGTPDPTLDPKPSLPSETEVPRVSWEQVIVPSQKLLKKPGVLRRLFSWVFGPAESIVLAGDPKTAAGVEAGLRALVASKPELFDGLKATDLRTVLAKHVPGQAGLADMFYVNFRQTRETLEVDGTYLNFVVKQLDGKAVVVASTAQLYPKLDVDTRGTLDAEAAKNKAVERLGLPPNAGEELRDLDRRVMHLGGKWRAVQVLFSQRRMAMVAVDVSTGETFAWDPRWHSQEGTTVGRGVADGPQKTDTVLTELALGHVEIKQANGKTTFADADGKFTVEGEGDAPVQITVRLHGRYASVKNQTGKDLTVTVTAKPGEVLRAVFNPEGADEQAVADVNAYYFVTKTNDWLRKHGIDLEGLNKPMPINTNIDDECNAYYTPWNPSLNFFKSSARCANSSYSDVAPHEYGHAADDASGGILNGGLSEALGDVLTMGMTNQPIVGRGFLKEGARDYIRHGENTYQYRSRDEVHAQGQAFMGFYWKLRLALTASMGDAVKAVELTNHLVVPIILSKARDIPAAIQQVLLRDVDANGVAPHLKEIQAAAKAHGIDVKLPRSGDMEEGQPGLFARLGGWVGRAVTGKALGLESIEVMGTRNLGDADLGTRNLGELEAGTRDLGDRNLGTRNLGTRNLGPVASVVGYNRVAAADPDQDIGPKELVKVRLPFTAGAMVRGRIANEIRKYCDYHGLKYELKEYKGWFESDFLLTVEGEWGVIHNLIVQLQAIGK